MSTPAYLNRHSATSPLSFFSQTGDLKTIAYIFVCTVHLHPSPKNLSKLTARDAAGRTPLYWACANGHLPVAKFLQEKFGTRLIFNCDRENTTIVMAAAANGHRHVLEWIYKVWTGGAGVDVSLWQQCNNKHRSCISVALANGDLKCATFCHAIANSPQLLHQRDTSQLTPFDVALNHPRFAVCHWLILHGALNGTRALTELQTSADRARFKGFSRRIADSSVFEWPVIAGFEDAFAFRESLRGLRGLNEDVLSVVAGFVGAEFGGWRRNAREVAEALELAAGQE